MNQTQSSGSDRRNDIKLIELSVVLVANSNNPSIINPDFLRYNKIVDDSYEVQDSPISTPAFSQIIFKNGITVASTPDRVIFSHTGNFDEENVSSPGIAKRYIECVPHVPYHALGINPKGIVSGQAPNPILNMLRDNGSWMSFKDVIPEGQLKAIYRYTERTIFLDIGGADVAENNQTTSGILFQANIHRELSEMDAESRIKRISSLLDTWENDLDDFCNLTNKFLQER